MFKLIEATCTGACINQRSSSFISLKAFSFFLLLVSMCASRGMSILWLFECHLSSVDPEKEPKDKLACGELSSVAFLTTKFRKKFGFVSTKLFASRQLLEN